MPKIAWCLQNFLTMEFYRKICNKCYWNNVYSKEHSVWKNTLLVIISILPVLFLSFFYLPTDPANSSRSSSALSSVRDFLTARLGLCGLADPLLNKLLSFTSFEIDPRRLVSSQDEILGSLSVLRI